MRNVVPYNVVNELKCAVYTQCMEVKKRPARYNEYLFVVGSNNKNENKSKDT